MAPKACITPLIRNREGATSIIVAGSILTLVGAAAVAIDFGSVFLAKRQLQGIADAAAMAAADDIQNGGHGPAQAIITRSGAQAVSLHHLIPGRYTRDKSVALGQRFSAQALAPTAARVVLTQDVPLFFGALLTGRRAMTIRAQATAARTDMAAFSLGTRLAELSGGLPNQILSALAGTQLGLTALDGNTLAATNLDLLHFADALRVKLDKPEATYAEVFRTPLPLADVVAAMAAVAPDDGGRLLDGISGKLTGGAIRVSDLIDLGPLGQADFNDGKAEITIDAFSMLRSALELSHGDQYKVSLDVSALGLANTQLKLVGGSGKVHSPFMTITQANDVVIRTAQTRLYLDTQLGTGPLNIVSLRLPVYTELAAAEARLASIACGSGGGGSAGVTLRVTPAIGSVAIADIDKKAMEVLTKPLVTTPAVLAYTPLAQVHGSAKVALGGVTPQSVHFTPEQIEAKLVKSVKTNDLVGGVAVSLVNDLKIDVTLLGGSLLGGLGLGPLGSTVGSQLKLVAPAVDLLLGQVTDTLGLRLGVADVRVEKMRCGVPLIVS